MLASMFLKSPKNYLSNFANRDDIRESLKQFRFSNLLVFRAFGADYFVSDMNMYNGLTGELLIVTMFSSNKKLSDANLAKIVIPSEIVNQITRRCSKSSN